MIQKTVCLCIMVLIMLPHAAITTNPLISKYKPIFASFPGSPAALVNGKFGETAWSITDSSWIALKLAAGPSRVLFTWNSPNHMWSDELGTPDSCVAELPLPVSYKLLVSGNSTNGTDGDWKVADSVLANRVSARSHVIEFTGSHWIKMEIISGKGKVDEVEVFDISTGSDDTWFFAGTEITANAFKKPAQLKEFGFFIAEIAQDFNVTATPAFIRGGNGCLSAAKLAADIHRYLDMVPGIKYFAIELGTVDSWGGGSASDAKAFAINLQKIVKACRARKVEPIFARTPATNPEVATWQIHEEYLKAIDAVTKKNKLTPGPDLYNWFLQHPEQLSPDGINPGRSGGSNIQRLWAEAVYTLYQKNEKK